MNGLQISKLVDHMKEIFFKKIDNFVINCLQDKIYIMLEKQEAKKITCKARRKK